jgi:hypothetical protein
MGMSHLSQTLSQQIEQLVREHIESARRAAGEAVERAFASSPSSQRSPSSGTRRRAAGRRRAPDEISALGEKLYGAVVAEPGETMAVLAPVVGAAPRELHRPMATLKRDGRVRSVGQRHQTRYYPTAGGR